MLKVLDARMNIVHAFRRCVSGKWPHEVFFEVLGLSDELRDADASKGKPCKKASPANVHAPSGNRPVIAKMREPN